LTGSIGVVTINMPRIGYLSDNEDDFFERLKNLMILSKKAWRQRGRCWKKFTDGDLYPYTKILFKGYKEKI